MSYSNETPNLKLPQYQRCDKPAWLGDINPAFKTLDDFAGETETKITDLTQRVETAEQEIDELQTTVETEKERLDCVQNVVQQHSQSIVDIWEQVETNIVNINNNSQTIISNTDRIEKLEHGGAGGVKGLNAKVVNDASRVLIGRLSSAQTNAAINASLLQYNDFGVKLDFICTVNGALTPTTFGGISYYAIGAISGNPYNLASPMATPIFIGSGHPITTGATKWSVQYFVHFSGQNTSLYISSSGNETENRQYTYSGYYPKSLSLHDVALNPTVPPDPSVPDVPSLATDTYNSNVLNEIFKNYFVKINQSLPENSIVGTLEFNQTRITLDIACDFIAPPSTMDINDRVFYVLGSFSVPSQVSFLQPNHLYPIGVTNYWFYESNLPSGPNTPYANRGVPDVDPDGPTGPNNPRSTNIYCYCQGAGGKSYVLSGSGPADIPSGYQGTMEFHGSAALDVDFSKATVINPTPNLDFAYNNFRNIVVTKNTNIAPLDQINVPIKNSYMLNDLLLIELNCNLIVGTADPLDNIELFWLTWEELPNYQVVAMPSFYVHDQDNNAYLFSWAIKTVGSEPQRLVCRCKAASSSTSFICDFNPKIILRKKSAD